MTTNRDERWRDAPQRTNQRDKSRRPLEQRREEMHAAEGHSGSIPRGNQHAEDESLGHRRLEYERILGH
jgi:hypothetical protein